MFVKNLPTLWRGGGREGKDGEGGKAGRWWGRSKAAYTDDLLEPCCALFIDSVIA